MTPLTPPQQPARVLADQHHGEAVLGSPCRSARLRPGRGGNGRSRGRRFRGWRPHDGTPGGSAPMVKAARRRPLPALSGARAVVVSAGGRGSQSAKGRAVS